MFYHLKVNPSDTVVSEFGNDDFLKCVGYLKGLQFEQWVPKDSEVDVLIENKPTDFFKVGQLYIVSQKLINIFKSAGANIEVLPAKLTNKKGESFKGYHLLNVLDFEDCFDTDNNVYEEKDGYYFRVESLILNTARINKDIFRVKNLAYYLIFVSKGIKNRVISEKISGIEFLECNGIRLK